MSHLTDEHKKIIDQAIRTIPDFPKPGIGFKDITTLLSNKEAFNLLMDHLATKYGQENLDYIAGIESRGFIFGSALASKLNIGFVPVRKKGKLPGKTFARSYELEYGTDTVEIHIDAFEGNQNARVLLIDDLIATGGTAVAACELIKEAGGECIEACFIMSLSFLPGVEKLLPHTSVYSVLEID